MHAGFDAFMGLPLEELDFQLSPSRSAKDAAGVLNAMVTQTLAAQDDPALEVRIDLPFGPKPRQKFDLYQPKAAKPTPRPVIVFLHGGFWQEGDKSVSGFAASCFAARGWASIALGYTLTPEVSLTELTREIHAGLACVAAQGAALGIDTDNIILVGHSAGGHLAASVVCDLLGQGVHRLVRGAVLVSGVFELAPIARSYVSDLTPMTDAEIQDLSPLRHPPLASVPIHILVGADEPAAFQAQSSVLRTAWAPALPGLTYHLAAGRDHFDVLEELQDPTSITVRSIEQMIQGTAES